MMASSRCTSELVKKLGGTSFPRDTLITRDHVGCANSESADDVLVGQRPQPNGERPSSEETPFSARKPHVISSAHVNIDLLDECHRSVAFRGSNVGHVWQARDPAILVF